MPVFAFDPGQSDQPKATEQVCYEHTPPQIKARVHAIAIVPEEQPVKNAAGQLSIFSLEELPASPSVSPASEKAWLIRVATSPLRILPLLTAIGPSGWSGRTSPACCRLTAEKRLEPSSEGWGNSGMGGPTESWTLSI